MITFKNIKKALKGLSLSSPIKENDLTPSTNFHLDLGMDSLIFYEFIYNLEVLTSIENNATFKIDDKKMWEIETIQDLLDYKEE